MLRSLAVFLLLCSLATAEGPKAIITDPSGNPLPEKVSVDTQVVYLSAKQSVVGENPDSLVWVIKPASRAERSKTYENNRELVIPLGKTSQPLTVILAVAKGDSISVAEVTLQVEGGSPNPPDPGPGPDPNPDPEPSPVPNEALAALVHRELVPLLANAALMEKFAMLTVAAGYRQAADEASSGKITTVDALLDRTKSLTRAALKNPALGGDLFPKYWEAPVRKVELHLQALGDAGKLPDLKSHIPLWREVAAGIESAAKL
jgi:hypothetical protein